MVIIVSRQEGLGLATYGMAIEISHGINLQPHTFIASL